MSGMLTDVIDIGADHASLMRTVSEVVWPWIREQRWCPSASPLDPSEESPPTPVSLWEFPRKSEDEETLVWILLIRSPGGSLLQVPLLASPQEESPPTDHLPLGTVDQWGLYDATHSPLFWRAWGRQAEIITGSRAALLQAASIIRIPTFEQSNTSVILEGGEKPLIAKVFRTLYPGRHPEVELPGALTQADWAGVPALWATWNFPVNGDDATPVCSAVVSTVVDQAEDGFDFFVRLAEKEEDPRVPARSLGQITGQMHRLLADIFDTGDPLTSDALRARIERSLADIGAEGISGLDEDSALSAALSERLATELGDGEEAWTTTRIHGDYHLGQTLISDGSWYVLDFEGEPLRPLEERSRPDVPLRDVAGMLRSFDYAWRAAHEEDLGSESEWTEAAQEAFLEGYASEISLTDSDVLLLDILQIEKALYEAVYEARFRPRYQRVPLAALEALAQ